MGKHQWVAATYFIDKFVLHAGNEKGNDKADTIGCCPLFCKHITLEPPNKLVFDFLSNASIQSYDKVTVDEQVYKNIWVFKNGKNTEDKLFNCVNVHLCSNPSTMPCVVDVMICWHSKLPSSIVHEGPVFCTHNMLLMLQDSLAVVHLRGVQYRRRSTCTTT